ncbi:hypothetical protein D7316_03962 [Gordonia insulae]|uniref:Uncharacterized protein n=1 Tax=Gordonia insulae TaxID=2420509 RepID=A0A3G8JQZ2_9ACTN|nr:hypothetical protein D7316_03962 [Gordonia insulae]
MPAVGPSNAKLISRNGIGGTTDIQRVMRSGSPGRAGWTLTASLLPMLPKAQPRPPRTVRIIGMIAATPSELWVARSIPIRIMPITATAIPMTWSGLIRSRKNSTPSSTVNGAEVWSTSDASPVGIPRSIARKRNENCRTPKPTAYSRNHLTWTLGKRTNSTTGIAITEKRSAAQKNGGN